MRRGVDVLVPGCARALARRRVGHADVRVDAGDTRETPDVALIGRGRAWGCARGVCWAEATLLFSKVSKSRVNICGCTFRFLETEMTCAPSKKKSESADRAGTGASPARLRFRVCSAFFVEKSAAERVSAQKRWRADAASPCWWTTPPARCARAATARSTCSTRTRTSCS